MSTIEQKMKMKCRHFNGVQNGTCEKNIKYMDVRQLHPDRMATFPCTDPDTQHICSLWEPHTAEEIKEVEDRATNAVKGLIDFEQRKTEGCPHCGKHVTRLEQVGHCTYARPCNCRLWQGKIPEAWLDHPCEHIHVGDLQFDGTIRCEDCGEVLREI